MKRDNLISLAHGDEVTTTVPTMGNLNLYRSNISVKESW